ncbi:hypothetical protein J4Q44_G00347320 [Coregonus suidteri]|uniref:Uncharacterized protein n=1 Tax=Coregonus suidteri TaxID=861788 RepID=A0AAN8QD41_9TELE
MLGVIGCFVATVVWSGLLARRTWKPSEEALQSRVSMVNVGSKSIDTTTAGGFGDGGESDLCGPSPVLTVLKGHDKLNNPLGLSSKKSQSPKPSSNQAEAQHHPQYNTHCSPWSLARHTRFHTQTGSSISGHSVPGAWPKQVPCLQLHPTTPLHARNTGTAELESLTLLLLTIQF